MVNDPIADMFIRIKNAQAVMHETITFPASLQNERVARVLQENGYIKSVARKTNKPSDSLIIELRYVDKQPAITHIKRVSKPGARRYSGVSRIPRPLSGHGLVILSTPKGVMSGLQAEKLGLGGEVIGTVW
jgi:small subunit ribosomal protein S8